MRRLSALVLGLVVLLAGGSARAAPLGFHDKEYAFELMRVMGVSAAGASDLGECLETARHIREGDDESWYAAWHATAARLRAEAVASPHAATAAGRYLRASSYFRCAEFFLHADPRDPRILETSRASRDCFLAFAKLQREVDILPVEIPFEGTHLPGYLCLPRHRTARLPLIIVQTGFDGTGEELYAEVGLFAVRRGLACLIFEGPGQGRVIREQHLPFRPDWETVIRPVVDFACGRAEVDAARIGLLGRSFGGYLAPRAAAFEKRLKLVVANGGLYDFDLTRGPGQPKNLNRLLTDTAACARIDEAILARMKQDVAARWFYNDGMWKFAARTPSEWLRMTEAYTMRDCVARVDCHTLIVDAENETALAGQAIKLYEALRCPKTFMLFTEAEGAGEHCQVGAVLRSNERILDWVEDHL